MKVEIHKDTVWDQATGVHRMVWNIIQTDPPCSPTEALLASSLVYGNAEALVAAVNGNSKEGG